MAAVLGVAWLAACESDSPTDPSDGLTAISVQVLAGSSTPVEGDEVTLQAVGTLSDGSTEDVTGEVTWSSEAAAVAVNGNDVQARMAGAATVVARAGDVEGSIDLLVQPAAVVRAATVSLLPTFPYDLDAGTVGLAGADVAFEVEAALLYLGFSVAASPASAVVVGTGQPGRGGCAFAFGYSSTRIAFASLVPGLYLCVRTNGGDLAELRVLTVPLSSSDAFVFAYRLFEGAGN